MKISLIKLHELIKSFPFLFIFGIYQFLFMILHYFKNKFIKFMHIYSQFNPNSNINKPYGHKLSLLFN